MTVRYWYDCKLSRPALEPDSDDTDEFAEKFTKKKGGGNIRDLVGTAKTVSVPFYANPRIIPLKTTLRPHSLWLIFRV